MSNMAAMAAILKKISNFFFAFLHVLSDFQQKNKKKIFGMSTRLNLIIIAADFLEIQVDIISVPTWDASVYFYFYFHTCFIKMHVLSTHDQVMLSIWININKYVCIYFLLRAPLDLVDSRG